MTRRRKIILGIALVGAVAIPWAIPACRYRIVGVLKREPFYQGMPASYWRDRFLQFEEDYQQRKAEWEYAATGRQSFQSRLRDRLEEKFPAIARPEVELPRLYDPGAIPVLIVLLLDENDLVSHRSSSALAVIGEPAVPALVELLQNRSAKVRLTAIVTLNSFTDHSAEGAIPALREATRDVNKEVALEAIAHLANRDASFRDSAVSAVIELLNDQNTDRRIREEAVAELGNLCFGGLGEQAQAAAASAIKEASSDGDKGVAERARLLLDAMVQPARSER
jgi:hypothetical protein